MLAYKNGCLKNMTMIFNNHSIKIKFGEFFNLNKLLYQNTWNGCLKNMTMIFNNHSIKIKFGEFFNLNKLLYQNTVGRLTFEHFSVKTRIKSSELGPD